MRQLLCLAALGIALLSSACASLTPPIPEATLPRPHPIGAPSATATDEPSASDQQPPAPLALEDAIRIALLNNPGLRAEFAAFESAAQQVPQASSLMDPRLSYNQFVEGVQTRTGEQQFTAGVSQMFPWFGKLRLQGEVARSKAMQSLETYRASMLDVRERVTKAWYRLAYEHAALLLLEEDRRTIEQTLDAASALYGAGERGRGALLQSQAELARVENEIAGFPAKIAVLREELRRLLYSEAPVDAPVLETIPVADSENLRADSLIAAAIESRPELERLRLQTHQAELSGELARRDYFPDFTLGLNYIGIGDRPDNPSGNMAPSDEGDDAWGVSFGINIPIPNARRRAAELQAAKDREKAEWLRVEMESKIQEQVRGLIPRMSAISRQMSILTDNLLPLAEEAFATNQSGYTTGTATFLELLDSQRTLLAVRRDVLRTRRDYHVTLAELERTLGGQISAEEQP